MKPVLIVQNCEAESSGSIPDYLRRRQIPYTILHSYLRQPFPATSELQAVINLGSPLSVTTYQEHDFLRDLYGFTSEVVRADLPYFGICFGGQFLAKVLGARVERNPVKEIGLYDIRLTEAGANDPLFEGFATPFPAIHWHSDTFRVPFGAQLLAEGDDCKNQAFRSGRFIALQFHPEAGSSEVANWCDAYPHELLEAGKNREQVLAAARKADVAIRQGCDRLLDGFFRMNQN
jgi:GMP synthase (glutamine-hydrolysing)